MLGPPLPRLYPFNKTKKIKGQTSKSMRYKKTPFTTTSMSWLGHPFIHFPFHFYFVAAAAFSRAKLKNSFSQLLQKIILVSKKSFNPLFQEKKLSPFRFFLASYFSPFLEPGPASEIQFIGKCFRALLVWEQLSLSRVPGCVSLWRKAIKMEIVVDFEKPVLFSFEFKVKVTSPNISMSYLGF